MNISEREQGYITASDKSTKADEAPFSPGADGGGFLGLQAQSC